ncbi:unnamed protein product [Pleuronectes platessa]|uniref:Uncharacterized protein n=1 Tax=Pleuronectes platessa TaxID=8262 RepID=A0A9N7UQB5_PLEPL|nr:unnamed protein product [Pleuronectes platessa]
MSRFVPEIQFNIIFIKPVIDLHRLLLALLLSHRRWTTAVEVDVVSLMLPNTPSPEAVMLTLSDSDNAKRLRQQLLPSRPTVDVQTPLPAALPPPLPDLWDETEISSHGFEDPEVTESKTHPPTQTPAAGHTAEACE